MGRVGEGGESAFRLRHSPSGCSLTAPDVAPPPSKPLASHSGGGVRAAENLPAAPPAPPQPRRERLPTAAGDAKTQDPFALCPPEGDGAETDGEESNLRLLNWRRTMRKRGLSLVDFRWAKKRGFWDSEAKRWVEEVGGKVGYLQWRRQARVALERGGEGSESDGEIVFERGLMSAPQWRPHDSVAARESAELYPSPPLFSHPLQALQPLAAAPPSPFSLLPFLLHPTQHPLVSPRGLPSNPTVHSLEGGGARGLNLFAGLGPICLALEGGAENWAEVEMSFASCFGFHQIGDFD